MVWLGHETGGGLLWGWEVRAAGDGRVGLPLRLFDSKLGKVYIKAVYCHSAYLTYMQSSTS